MTQKPGLLIEFDNVIHDCVQPAQDPRVVLGLPVPGALAALTEYVKHFTVYIGTNRMEAGPAGKVAILSWMTIHFTNILVASGVPQKEAVDRVNTLCHLLKFPVGPKPVVQAEISALGVRFTGKFVKPEDLLAIKPWNSKE